MTNINVSLNQRSTVENVIVILQGLIIYHSKM